MRVRYNSMKELLDDGIIPHAAFVTGDEAAIGAINAINAICDVGYKVPEDISVAGFNDVKVIECIDLNLLQYINLYTIWAVAIRNGYVRNK